MANENYNTTIDQKLTELYEVLADLNTLKEKTAAVQHIVEGLSAAGKTRVAEIEASVGRLGVDIDKSIEIIRNTFVSSEKAAEETMAKSVAKVQTTLDKSVAKVVEAVDTAGKARIDSMKITADTFSQTVSGLVQSANEGTARMSEMVAELRGLPLVEELQAVKTYSEKLSEEIKKVTDSIVKIDGALAEARTSIEGEVDAFGKQISRMTERIESQNTDINNKISGLDDFVRIEFSQKMETEIESAQKNLSDKIDKLSVKMSSGFDEVTTVIRAAGDAVSKTVAEKLASEVVARLNTLKIFLVITTILSIAMLGMLGYIAFKP